MRFPILGPVPADSLSQTRSGADAYAAFKASLNAPSPQSAVESASPAPQTVKIVRRYRFAGEEITFVGFSPCIPRSGSLTTNYTEK